MKRASRSWRLWWVALLVGGPSCGGDNGQGPPDDGYAPAVVDSVALGPNGGGQDSLPTLLQLPPART